MTPDTVLYDRTRRALDDAPDIIGELRGIITPGSVPSDGARRHATLRRLPLNAAPVDDADDLYAALVEHAEATADLAHTKPPSRIQWAREGLPAGTPPEAAYRATLAITRWLEPHLHLIDDEDIRRDIMSDIITRVDKLNARYPVSARPEHVDARCGNCRRLTVYRHPPRSFRADEPHVCDQCGKHHTEQEIVALMASRQREQAFKKRRRAS